MSKKDYTLLYEIPYYLQDSGDGSHAVIECASSKIAEQMQEKDENRDGYAGEVESMAIYEKDGQLYFLANSQWDEENEEWLQEYIQLVKIKQKKPN